MKYYILYCFYLLDYEEIFNISKNYFLFLSIDNIFKSTKSLLDVEELNIWQIDYLNICKVPLLRMATKR